MPLLLALLSAPSALAGWTYFDEEGTCTYRSPDHHIAERHQRDYRRSEDLAEVEASARGVAQDRLVQRVCAGLSPSQCDAARRLIGVDVELDLERRRVCAVAMVSVQVIRDPGGRERHRAALKALAASIAQELDGATVGQLAVQLHSGCSAGRSGAELSAELLASLRQQGVRITRGGEGDQLVAELTLNGEQVAVEVWRHTPSAAATLVGTASLSPAWLGLNPLELEACRGIDGMGLRAGARPGGGGLLLDFTLSSADPLCAGEQVVARFRPSSPAEVQLWTVGRSGEAWLAWTSASAVKGPLDRSATLTLQANYVPALGQEVLLLLAAPSGTRLPSAQPGCRVRSLSDLEIDPDLAISTTPFSVLEPGLGRCTAHHQGGGTDWSAYQSAPLCK